ncbi:MAG: deoxyguanosinetriphosphate triphosphohydrolase [Acidobacteriota bacterium]
MRRVDHETRDAWERAYLSPAATRSAASRGRRQPEDDDDFRTHFERDRDRILHSKAFRRLKHKTQVFINPEGDHFVTRLTHTLQVTQIGRALAVALALNEPLVEAICLGHEVGHPPFGHTGEIALSPYVEDEWQHAAQGVRVFELLEPLNLTWEVLDGIRAHTWKVEPPPSTQEGWVIRYADRIAYLVHDMQDAIRAGVLTEADLPAATVKVLGPPGREWIARMIRGVIEESLKQGTVTMAPDVLAVMNDFRAFMFERVYLRPEAKLQADNAVKLLRDLVDYLLAHPEAVPDSYRQEGASNTQKVLDYVAGMTDRYALRKHDELFRPGGMV